MNRVCLLACALVLSGCGTWMVEPPAPFVEPRPVFLLDHGRHSSLVPGRADDTLVRYSCGQWNGHVLDRKGVRASGAVLGVGQAGIGRRNPSGPPSAEAVRNQVPVSSADT